MHAVSLAPPAAAPGHGRQGALVSTAQGGVASSVLDVVVYVASLRTVRSRPGLGGSWRRPHPVAVVLWLLVAVPSLLQLASPRVFDALSRQPVLIEHGEWWRLVTSALVQDGGLVGTAYNLVTLALAASAATAARHPAWVVPVFVVGALVFHLSATYLWREAGGGSSGATFFLMTSTLGVLLLRPRPRGLAAGGSVAG